MNVLPDAQRIERIVRVESNTDAQYAMGAPIGLTVDVIIKDSNNQENKLNVYSGSDWLRAVHFFQHYTRQHMEQSNVAG